MLARLSTVACPTCQGTVDVRSPHVVVAGTAVRVYCSAPCMAARDAPIAEPTTASIDVPRRRTRWPWLAAMLAPGAVVAWFAIEHAGAQDVAAPPPLDTPTSVEPSEPAIATTGDPQQDADNAVMAELSSDTWIVPLAGPTRRMPSTHNGAFGAERDGERPPECLSGHCGVDLGNLWGEPIYAVHDGVIDFVQRGSNDERGGMFVRIAHRGGTLFSWYFHLAAIPRDIRPGAKVSVGRMIGLLGDTGIKHSAPHLHFALSVKHSKYARERYLDPEPLIAIWPLWIPNETRTGGHISNDAEPGMPVRR